MTNVNLHQISTTLNFKHIWKIRLSAAFRGSMVTEIKKRLIYH